MHVTIAYSLSTPGKSAMGAADAYGPFRHRADVVVGNEIGRSFFLPYLGELEKLGNLVQHLDALLVRVQFIDQEILMLRCSVDFCHRDVCGRSRNGIASANCL